MIQTLNETYLCEICEEHFHSLPLGGMSSEYSALWPLRICPACGPVDWEVMQFCREAVMRTFEN